MCVVVVWDGCWRWWQGCCGGSRERGGTRPFGEEVDSGLGGFRGLEECPLRRKGGKDRGGGNGIASGKKRAVEI